MAVSAIRNVLRIDWLPLLAGNFSDSNNSFHPTDMSQLRRAQHNVANGVDSRFSRLHPAIRLDKAAVSLDLGSFQTNILCARFPPYCNKNLLGLNLLLLAIHTD